MVFGTLAQLVQPQMYVKARKFLTWHGCSSMEESTETSPALAGWTQGESYGWWSTNTRQLRRSAKGVVGKGWITVLPKAIQFWYSLGIYHNISLYARSVHSCTTLRKSLYVTIYHQSAELRRVWVGILSHSFQSFLPIVGFPLLCFWMALKNHKNFLSCSVSSLWPQNETNQNEKQPDQK